MKKMTLIPYAITLNSLYKKEYVEMLVLNDHLFQHHNLNIPSFNHTIILISNKTLLPRNIIIRLSFFSNEKIIWGKNVLCFR